MTAPGAPANVIVSRLSISDLMSLRRMRRRNADWLQTWQPRSVHVSDDSLVRHPGRLLRRAAAVSRRLARTVDLGQPHMREDYLIRAGNLPVGLVSVTRDLEQPDAVLLAYWVDHEAAGRGIATAALQQVIAGCASWRGVHLVRALIAESNEASRRTAARCGLVVISHGHQDLPVDGRLQSHDLWQLDFRGHPSGSPAR